MRIRLIKAHLKQVLLCGALVYILISLLGEDEKPQVSIAKKYKEYRKQAIEDVGIKSGKLNVLNLKNIEKKNGQVYGREISNAEAGDILNLESIYSQIPGGRQAIVNRDPVALEALASLLQNLKNNYISKIKLSPDIIKKLSSSLKAKQMTNSNIADSYDITSKMMKQLIQAFPNLKGNIPAQAAMIQKLTEANPNFSQMLNLLENDQKNKPKNIQNMKFDELVSMLDEIHHKNNQNPPILIKKVPESNEYNEAIYSEDIKEDDSISNDYVAKQQVINSQSEQQGEINLHELLKLKNLLNNGATVEELKRMYHLQVPQLIGRSLLAGENSKETTGDTMQERESDEMEQKAQGGDIEISESSQQTETEPKLFSESNDKQIIDKDKGLYGGDYAVTRDATFDEKKHLEEDEFIYMSSQEFDGLLEAQKNGATKRPDLDFEKIRIAVVDVEPSGMIDNVTKVLTIENYKRWKAERFVKKFANPFVKSRVKPTLTPYGDYIARPNPKSIITDLTRRVESDEIKEALAFDKKRRLALGDDNLLLIPEVKLEMQLNPDTITNIVHFIWFSCRRFRVHHFMSMKSALHIHSPRAILLHTDCIPTGPYFEEFTKMAGSKLKIVKRTPPTTIWGNKIERIEHRSDVARLQVLLEVGGIYMDDDVLLLKPLDPLMNNSIVLGEETYDALANSIVLANRNAWFLKRWYQEYKTFNGSKWSHSSCFVPWSLWRLFPDTIYVVKEKLLRPNWEELTYIYHELWDWTHSYSMHLYSRFMEALDGKRERSLQELAVLNTTYGEVSRFVLWGDHRPRDITDWL